MAKIVAVNISREKGKIKENVDEVMLIENFGLEGDAHGGPWHRQVSFLALESIDIMKKKGLDDLKSGMFAENITTEGITLHELPIGTILKMGDAQIEISQIGKECHHGCEIMQKVGTCIMPKQGIFGKVIKPGLIRPGVSIEVEYV